VNPSWISPQHCTLEYRNDHRNSLEPKASQLILGALLEFDHEDDQYKLKLLVDPEWREFVLEEDQEYVEALLKDITGRAKRDAETLFIQLCSLGVGPIVAIQVGRSLDPPSALLLEKFVPL
jgi:hypothetical protein